MSIKLSTQNHIPIIEINGRLDVKGLQDLEEMVRGTLDETDHMLFDFTDLDYINSSGLRILVMAYQQLSLKEGKVAICGTKDYIQEIFEVSGYDKIFHMYPTRDEAVSRL